MGWETINNVKSLNPTMMELVVWTKMAMWKGKRKMETCDDDIQAKGNLGSEVIDLLNISLAFVSLTY